MKNLLLVFLLLFANFPLLAHYQPGSRILSPKKWDKINVPWIRVLLKDERKEVSFLPKNTTLSLHIDQAGKWLSYDRTHSRLRLDCQSMVVGKTAKKELGIGHQRKKLIASLWNGQGHVALDRENYSGRIELWKSIDDKSCQVVNELPLEVYLVSLLGHEVRGDWPVEALKAQAIAARTYAYQKIMQVKLAANTSSVGNEQAAHFNIINSEKNQVSGDFSNIHPNQEVAIDKTWGEILIDRQGQIGEIFFHAQCGGQTLPSNAVWQNLVSGSVAVGCPYCQKQATQWEHQISYQDFWRLILSKDQSFKPENLKQLELQDNRLVLQGNGKKLILKKSDIRKFIGEKRLRSNHFSMKPAGNKIFFYGKGHGHGVGLCQMGMKYLAEKGYTYRQILAHYYPAHQIKKMY